MSEVCHLPVFMLLLGLGLRHKLLASMLRRKRSAADECLPDNYLDMTGRKMQGMSSTADSWLDHWSGVGRWGPRRGARGQVWVGGLGLAERCRWSFDLLVERESVDRLLACDKVKCHGRPARSR